MSESLFEPDVGPNFLYTFDWGWAARRSGN